MFGFVVEGNTAGSYDGQANKESLRVLVHVAAKALSEVSQPVGTVIMGA